jgi:hypothetical protein
VVVAGQQQQLPAQATQAPVLDATIPPFQDYDSLDCFPPAMPAEVAGQHLAMPAPLPQRTTAPGSLLSDDPFQCCARRALRGDFGPLEQWQRNAYAWGLAQGVTVQGTATLTTYYPQEGHRRGDEMRSGIGVNERYAAVLQREWRPLQQCYVWVEPTLNSRGQWVGGIRQVMDTGANSNHRRFALRYGTDRWLDYWYPQPHELVKSAGYCFIRTDRARLIP